MRTRRAFVWMAAATLAAGFLQGGAAAQALNKPPAGYKALFNGKNLEHWKGLIELPQRAKLSPEALKEAQEKADASMREHWSVKDGILTFDGKGQSLQTVKDYGNFEMFVDWRIQPKGDSGIYLRGNPQVQIWEQNSNAATADGKFIGSGGLYNNQKNPSRPIAVADKPVGEWNTFWIKMVGDRVTVKLNDVLVVDNTPLENFWERGKPLPTTGPIELQNHGNLLEFRNIYIKELPDNAAIPEKPKTAVAAARQETNLVTMTVKDAPLSQVVQLLAANGNAEIVFLDPEGKLGNLRMAYISIMNRSLDSALEKVCKAAGVQFTRENGVYYISAAR